MVISAVLGLLFLKQFEIPISVLRFEICIMIAGVIAFLWMSFAWVFFRSWWRKSGNIFRVISILLYPVTIFIFMWVAAFLTVPYIIRQIREERVDFD